ncbi:hypothetical protein [Hyphococcus lacteus]|uniref:Uncharacterized protein n=1 Tax=Hyphococcus lacteus TaxID=3143536 RepID=A0ABV3Z635_9PROT
MRKFVLLASVTFSIASGNALAHPGEKILTLGGGAERAATTSGIQYEEVGGVHVFRGSTALLGDEAVTTAPEKTDMKIVIVQRQWRTIRRLRTQGFYSGKPYPSRNYTQGFYSTGR